MMDFFVGVLCRSYFTLLANTRLCLSIWFLSCSVDIDKDVYFGGVGRDRRLTGVNFSGGSIGL